MKTSYMIPRAVPMALAILCLAAEVARGAMDRHPELKSRTVAWTEYDGSFLVNTNSRGEMLDFYWNVFAAPYPNVGWTGTLTPAVAGEISEQYRLREYAQLNAYRALNSSQPMTEDLTKRELVQAGALLFAQNFTRGISHTIDSSWIGYNAIAAEAAATSLLGGTSNPPYKLAGEADGMIDDGGNDDAVGHRAALLDDSTVLGTLGAACNAAGDSTRTVWHLVSSVRAVAPTQFIAWPAPGYLPYGLLHRNSNLRWSFALQDDTCSPYAIHGANVSAKVNGVTVPVRNVVRNYGIEPVTWDFDPADLDLATAPDGTEVEITVSNVVGVPAGDTTVRPYTYKVTFFDENTISSTGFSSRTPLTNISTRAVIGSGDNQLIAGFSVSGSTPVKVALRTQGPGLARYNITNPAGMTRVKVYDSSNNLLGENANWKTGPNWRLIQSLNLAPSSENEAALVLTLWPGNYTAIVSDDTGANGLGIVEAFNIDNLSESRLGNLSTRGMVGNDFQQLIAGFTIKDKSRTLVIRTQGPGLAKYNVSNPVNDTVLKIVSQATGETVATNDDWKTDSRNARLLTDLSGFAPSDNREAALVITLPPGAYTALVSPKDGKAGVGIVEIFDFEP